MRASIIALIGSLAVLQAVPASGAKLSIWADSDNLSISFPLSLAYNPVNGKLLLAGSDLLEWEKGATTGTLLVPSANWGDSPYGAVYIPSRGSYMVTSNDPDGVIEVLSGVPNQTPELFVDLTGVTGRPTGGMAQDGTYGYYKMQVTIPSSQPIRRFTLVGTNGVDSEYIPFSAIQAAGGNAISQQVNSDSAGKVHISLRASDNTKRGVYDWDSNGGVLVPVVQQPAIIAHTGQSLVLIKGFAFDAEENLYFYDIYSDDILKVDTNGVISTFLDDLVVESFMAEAGLSAPTSFDVWYMLTVGHQLVFMTGNISGHVLSTCMLEQYGDFDCDGDVDFDDHAFFVGVLTGPVDTVVVGYGQDHADEDDDSHVDLRDYAKFQIALGASP